MEEVVAKRHNAAGAGYIFVTLMGIALLAAGIALGTVEKGALVIGLIIGGILTVMGVYYLVKFFMIPVKAIVYKDGVLYLPRKVTCKPEELEKVFIKIYKGRYGAVSKYGKLELTVNGKVFKYNNIADVKRVQERLMELNRQAIDMLCQPVSEAPVQKAQPEVQPEEKPEADPFGEI